MEYLAEIFSAGDALNIAVAALIGTCLAVVALYQGSTRESRETKRQLNLLAERVARLEEAHKGSPTGAADLLREKMEKFPIPQPPSTNEVI